MPVALLTKHGNLFAFPVDYDGALDAQIVVSSRRAPLPHAGWRKLLALWMGMGVGCEVRMARVMRAEFDDLDVTSTGQPECFCVLADGLAAAWPTPDRDYVISVTIGDE